MGLKDRGYVTSRWNDFWGWVNVLRSNDSIDDKQWQVGVNVSVEGNKLITLPWYIESYAPWSWVSKSQGITVFSNYVITLHNRNMYVMNLTSWVVSTKTNAVANATDTYQIITTKSFGWKLTIITINTNVLATEDITWYEFDTATPWFTSITFTSLTNKNFKCGAFYDGKLLLWGNPAFPSSLYFSKTGSVASPTDLYDFSAYSSNAQNIWDGEAITSIVSNNSELFVFKTNSTWKQTWVSDTWADAVSKSFVYIFRQIASSWALNPFCTVCVEQEIIYFDGINIRRVAYEQNIAALSDSSLSKDISSIINTFPSNQSATATMYYSYPFVKLFLRDKFSANNSVGVVYNVVDKAFSFQSWADVIQGVGWLFNNRRTAYFVTSQTSMVYEDNIGYSYNWGNINVSHKSKRYVLGDWVDYKRISQVELYWKISYWLTTYIDIYVNWALIDTREIYYEDILLPTTWSTEMGNSLYGSNWEPVNELTDYVVRYEFFNDWRDFEFWIRSNWQWRFELHWLNLMYKAIKAYDIHN